MKLSVSSRFALMCGSLLFPFLSAQAAPLFKITDLGAFGTYYYVGANQNKISSFGYGVNDSGQVAGMSETVSVSPWGNNTRVFVTDSAGTLTNLGVLGGVQSHGYDVNSSGQVTGTSKPHIRGMETITLAPS